MRVACGQENLSGKDLDEQSGELGNREGSGHEGDEKSGENWAIARAQSGHEGEEQSVGGIAVYRTYSFQDVRRMPEWCQVVETDAEQPRES